MIKGSRHSQATREKISAKVAGIHIGRKLSEDQKRRQSIFMKGRKPSEETREKMRLAKLGKPNYARIGMKHTDEAKARCGVSNRGREMPAHVKDMLRSINTGRSPSLDVRQKIGAAHRREKSHWWKGGISTEAEIIRASIPMREWRRAVYGRDDFTCKECGQRGGKLHAHHIEHFSKNKALRFDVSNGVTLCVSCHRKAHAQCE